MLFEQIHFLILIFSLTYLINLTNGCTSFYCLNSCGKNLNRKRVGYKLILANNRDEDIYRPTLPANAWPPKDFNDWKPNDFECDLSELKSPYNLCVYGALDTLNNKPPEYYSTWLGINERGSLGNLLFFMDHSNKPAPVDHKSRGVIVGNYLQDSSWPGVEAFMQQLSDEKQSYKPFNYVQAEMSNITGDYDLYYLNNNSTESYEKLNLGAENLIFGISNSDPERPFQKVVKGEEEFSSIIDDYASHMNKDRLVNSLIQLLQNETSHMPDQTLADFMGSPDDHIVDGVSRIKANYSSFWKNGHTRTSTLIMVDLYDNVEYYEFNLTANSENRIEEWKMNSLKFKLKPLYKKNLPNSSSRLYISSFLYLMANLLILVL